MEGSSELIELRKIVSELRGALERDSPIIERIRLCGENRLLDFLGKMSLQYVLEPKIELRFRRLVSTTFTMSPDVGGDGSQIYDIPLIVLFTRLLASQHLMN